MKCKEKIPNIMSGSIIPPSEKSFSMFLFFLVNGIRSIHEYKAKICSLSNMYDQSSVNIIFFCAFFLSSSPYLNRFCYHSNYYIINHHVFYWLIILSIRIVNTTSVYHLSNPKNRKQKNYPILFKAFLRFQSSLLFVYIFSMFIQQEYK